MLVKMYRRTVAGTEVDIMRKVRDKAVGNTADAYKAGLALLKTARPELYNPTFIASAHNNRAADGGQTININNLTVETMNSLPLPERKQLYDSYMESKGRGRVIDAKPQLALPDPDNNPERWLAEMKAARAANAAVPDLSSLA